MPPSLGPAVPVTATWAISTFSAGAGATYNAYIYKLDT